MPNITQYKCKPCEEKRYHKMREELRAINIPLPQHDDEFMQLCSVVAAARPKVFVEVGTRDGGSLWMLAQYCKKGATIVSIDLVGGKWGNAASGANRERIANQMKARGYDVHLLDGDSQSDEMKVRLQELLAGREIDLLFLDGDHSFKGVLRDWELYHLLVKSGGMVAFHDINDCPSNAPRVLVHFLWRTLKTIYRHQEFVKNAKGIFGIGVLWK